jgi:hypothetical protein
MTGPHIVVDGRQTPTLTIAYYYINRQEKRARSDASKQITPRPVFSRSAGLTDALLTVLSPLYHSRHIIRQCAQNGQLDTR